MIIFPYHKSSHSYYLHSHVCAHLVVGIFILLSSSLSKANCIFQSLAGVRLTKQGPFHWKNLILSLFQNLSNVNISSATYEMETHMPPGMFSALSLNSSCSYCHNVCDITWAAILSCLYETAFFDIILQLWVCPFLHEHSCTLMGMVWYAAHLGLSTPPSPIIKALTNWGSMFNCHLLKEEASLMRVVLFYGYRNKPLGVVLTLILSPFSRVYY